MKQKLRNRYDITFLNFAILGKCFLDYEAKIKKALLIKRHRSNPNRQCYASGWSFVFRLTYINFTITVLTLSYCNTTFHFGPLT